MKLIFAAMLLLVVGCKSMTPGRLDRVQAFSDQPHAGNVYLLRGFIGIWSHGVDQLGARIRGAGIRAHVYQEDQWSALADEIIKRYRNVRQHEPLVLIGHSYGADDTIKIARRLDDHGMNVDLIITLDPVTPPKVPKNVKLVYNLYQSNTLDALPFFRGIALEVESPTQRNLQNVNIRTARRDLLKPGTDHFNIEKNERIHEEVVAKLLEHCPTREVWVSRMQSAPARTVQAAPGAVPPARAMQPSGPPPAAARVGSTDTRLDRIP